MRTVFFIAIILWTLYGLFMLVRLILAARAERPDPRRLDEFPEHFLEWPREKQMSYLRHPQHADRCSCRRYGIVADASVRDEYGLHSRDRCQPDREVI